MDQPRAKGDESGELGIDIAWMMVLKRAVDAESPAKHVEETLECLRGLPTGVGSGVLDADILLGMVPIQRINVLDIINKKGLAGRVSADHAIAIWLYTLEYPSVYRAINTAMFCRHRRTAEGGISEHLEQAMPFIRYLNHALKSLPEEFHFKGRCFRGIRHVFPSPEEHDLPKHFVGKITVFFYEFKSATQDKELMLEDRYCGRRGARTIIEIDAVQGYKIDMFSQFGDQEKDVLFPPLSMFRFVSCSQNCHPNGSDDLRADIVVLQQVAETAPVASSPAEPSVLHVVSEAARMREINRAKDMGDVTSIVQIMRTHERHADVQEQGCWALRILAMNADSKVKAAHSGGIAMVISAMSKHEGHAGVQEHGCAALRILAMNADNKVKVSEAGGIEVVISAMSKHKGHAGVQELGSWALRIFAMNADNKVKVAQVGGIDVVISAMWNYEGHAGVQKQGCAALRILAVNADNKVKIAQAGGIEMVVSAMSKHEGHAGVQEHGCAALGVLAFNAEIGVKVAQAGGIEAVITGIRKHEGHAGVQELGCGALRILAVNADNKVKIAQAGGIEVVISAMRKHEGHASVQEHGCVVLAGLAFNVGNKVIIKDFGGLALARICYDKHKLDVAQRLTNTLR
jgi:hypothetical protein